MPVTVAAPAATPKRTASCTIEKLHHELTHRVAAGPEGFGGTAQFANDPRHLETAAARVDSGCEQRSLCSATTRSTEQLLSTAGFSVSVTIAGMPFPSITRSARVGPSTL